MWQITLKGQLGKKEDIGGAAGMVDVAGSLAAESAGAVDECCVGSGGNAAAEMAMAVSGGVGDISCTGGVGSADETSFSRIIASERVMGEGGDGIMKAGGVLEGGVLGGGVSGAALPAGVEMTGDSSNSSSESVSCSNSTSQRRLAAFRVRLAGGEMVSVG
jgi:hypothetical protein